MPGRDGCVILLLLLHGLGLAHSLETLRIRELIRSILSPVIKPVLMQELQQLQEPGEESLMTSTDAWPGVRKQDELRYTQDPQAPGSS